VSGSRKSTSLKIKIKIKNNINEKNSSTIEPDFGKLAAAKHQTSH